MLCVCSFVVVCCSGSVFCCSCCFNVVISCFVDAANTLFLMLFWCCQVTQILVSMATSHMGCSMEPWKPHTEYTMWSQLQGIIWAEHSPVSCGIHVTCM